jgi:hypothetical protein
MPKHRAALNPAPVLDQVVLVVPPDRPDWPIRGLGIATAGSFKLRASYWLKVKANGALRVRITSCDPPRRGRVVYHFTVTTRLRASAN